MHARHGNNRDGNADDERQQDGIRHRALRAVLILRPEALRREYGEARRQSLRKTQHQKHDCSRTADGRQCVRPDKITHNDRVGHIVKRLKNIADQDRYHKAHDHAHRFSDCQICFHLSPLMSPTFSNGHPTLSRLILFAQFYIFALPATSV